MKLYYGLILLLMLSFSSAFLGEFKQDDCMEILTILNSTQVNLSTITYPNNTVLFIDNPMTQNGKTFNYTFCGTDLPGDYIYDYFDNKGETYVNNFRVTYTGEDLNESYSSLYAILIGVLFIFMMITIWFTTKLPDSNSKDEEGRIIQVSWLKYARMPLWGVVYMLIFSILLISSRLSIAWLPFGSFIGDLLFGIAITMGWLGIPFIIIFMIYTIDGIIKDAHIKKLMDRGIDVDGP